MRYRGSLTIPAGTSEVSPASLTVPLCYGTIIEVELLFPAGQAGLTHVTIWYHERQIFPSSPEEDFSGDDHLIDFPEHYPIHEEPFEIELRGWAPDAELDHVVYVDLSVERPVLLEAGGIVSVPLPEGF